MHLQNQLLCPYEKGVEFILAIHSCVVNGILKSFRETLIWKLQQFSVALIPLPHGKLLLRLREQFHDPIKPNTLGSIYFRMKSIATIQIRVEFRKGNRQMGEVF